MFSTFIELWKNHRKMVILWQFHGILWDLPSGFIKPNGMEVSRGFQLGKSPDSMVHCRIATFDYQRVGDFTYGMNLEVLEDRSTAELASLEAYGSRFPVWLPSCTTDIDVDNSPSSVDHFPSKPLVFRPCTLPHGTTCDSYDPPSMPLVECYSSNMDSSQAMEN